MHRVDGPRFAYEDEGQDEADYADCRVDVEGPAYPPSRRNQAADRRPERERELRAREMGVSYVPLDGDIAVITSGAGLGMCTLGKQRGANATSIPAIGEGRPVNESGEDWILNRASR